MTTCIRPVAPPPAQSVSVGLVCAGRGSSYPNHAMLLNPAFGANVSAQDIRHDQAEHVKRGRLCDSNGITPDPDLKPTH